MKSALFRALERAGEVPGMQQESTIHNQVGREKEKNGCRDRFLNILRSWLAHPWFPIHVSVVGMVLMLPALWVGFQFDDYVQRAMMLEYIPLPHSGFWGKLNIFVTLTGNPPFNDFLRDMGFLQWWSSSHLKMSFFRPLSGLTMWIDYQLWPNWPSLMHLQSLLWYGGLIVVVALYYRRLMGVATMAGLAALFYAFDFSHAFPTAWLANRNALIAVFFGVCCLFYYDRSRREGKGRFGMISAVFFGLALCSGESALATLAYLLAYALFIDRDKGRKAFTALWPCALVFIIWAGIYKTFGFGTYGSGSYLDPLASPGAFMAALIVRVPLLLMGQWSQIPAENAAMSFGMTPALIFSFVLILILTLVLHPIIRKDRVARFWLTGMLLSLLPVAGIEPNNRLLFFSGLGAMGLMAQLILYMKAKAGCLPVSRFWRVPAFVVMIYLILGRMIFSPLVMPISVYMLKPVGDPFAEAVRHLPNNSKLAGQSLIIVNTPFVLSSALILPVRKLENRTLPAFIRELSANGLPVEIKRVDENAIKVRVAGGLFKGNAGRLWRSDDEPIAVNQEFKVPGMTAKVTQVGKDGPEEIVYRFSVPLEDQSLRWVQWKNKTYAPFTPPAIGESVFLPEFKLEELFKG